MIDDIGGVELIDEREIALVDDLIEDGADDRHVALFRTLPTSPS
ncbi:MAG: hypothetical protein U0232_04240 [Thermomicrobiales bacterium]